MNGRRQTRPSFPFQTVAPHTAGVPPGRSTYQPCSALATVENLYLWGRSYKICH